jgi:hypothetical protein
MSVASGGDDPRNDHDLASVADLLETLIDELQARAEKNENDRIGPITRSVLLDAVLPEVERVLTTCPDSSHIRIARTCVSGRQHREELSKPNAQLTTLDELPALLTVLQCLRIEQDQREGAESRKDNAENKGPQGFGHKWHGGGQPGPNRPRHNRESNKRQTEFYGISLLHER